MIKLIIALSLFSGVFLNASQEKLTLEQLVHSIQLQENKKVKIRYEMLDEILFESEDANILEKLKLANNFVNRATYLRDIDHWRKHDYWATPDEFMRTGAGDSEDFALMKYYVLTLMGINEDQLKIMIYDKPNPIKVKRHNKFYTDYENIVLAYYHTQKSPPIILAAKNKNIFEERKSFLLTQIEHEPSNNSHIVDVDKKSEGVFLEDPVVFYEQ